MSTAEDIAAKAFENIISRTDENGKLPGESGSNVPAPKVEAERNSPAEEEEAHEETASADTDGEESQQTDNDQDEDEDGLVTVNLDGQSYKVPPALKERIEGRSADYTRKTQALSEEKKQVEQHLNMLNAEKQAVLQQSTAYKQRLEHLDSIIGNTLKENTPDWDRLRVENPTEYLIQRDIHNQIREYQQKIQHDYQQVKAQEEQELQTYHTKVINAALVQLKEMDPSWQDDKVFQKDIMAAANYVKNTLGATDQELYGANDPKVWRMAVLAMRHDQLTNQVNHVKSKATKGKTISAGTTVSRPKGTSLQKDISRLRERGATVDDAASVFSRLLNI